MDSNEGEHALQNEQPSQGQGDEGQSGCTTLAPMRRVCHGICPRMFARNTPHVVSRLHYLVAHIVIYLFYLFLVVHLRVQRPATVL